MTSEIAALAQGPAISRGLVEFLADQRTLGRRPLFVLGAGVSSEVVPLLRDIGGWLATRDELQAPKYAQLLDKAERLSNDTVEHRREVAELFSAVQSDAPEMRRIWKAFSEAFLWDGLDSRTTGVLKVKPTKAHELIAQAAGSSGSRVLSLNFDGLTYRALQNGADPGLMLHTSTEIDGYFCAASTEQLPAVFKVRGDVFFARCSEPKCPLSARDEPIFWKFPEEPEADQPLKCQICKKGDLLLRFSFPGFRSKEESAYPALWTIRRYLAQSTAAIIILGFSGKWDRYLVEFLVDWAIERDIPLIDVNRTSPEARVLYQYQSTAEPRLQLGGEHIQPEGTALHLVESDAEAFMASITPGTPPTPSVPGSTVKYPRAERDRSGTIEPRYLCSERYFPDGAPYLIRPRADGDKVITVDSFTNGSKLPQPGIDENCQRYLRGLSQLGLKELWIGGAPASKHSRWHHSRGAANVVRIWLSALEHKERVPSEVFPWDSDPWPKAHLLLETAMFLHDIGHLPFSHLTEQALEHMNWIPIPRRGRLSGLEPALAERRLQDGDPNALASHAIAALADHLRVSPERARAMLSALMFGRHGAPWLQAMVNSPIDADKIDYLRFDSEFLSSAGIAEELRMATLGWGAWLPEFLSDQRVNHAGVLCLDGVSARAAADLWRHRVYLFDRFYVSPQMRIPERIAQEIIEQFAIQVTMNDAFRRQIPYEALSKLPGFLAQARVTMNDPVSSKFAVAAAAFTSLSPLQGGFDLEWPTLKQMKEWLLEIGHLEEAYAEFLRHAFAVLERLVAPLDGSTSVRRSSPQALMASSLVREPIQFDRASYARAVELLRPLQHIYKSEVLIDCVAMPRVLAPARRWRASREGVVAVTLDVDAQVLVPGSDIKTWGPGARATRPLTDETVAALERPLSRVLVIAPDDAASPAAEYVWDRTRATLLDAGIQLL